jgi:pimeloyl-ACP methyl ester carboxylesterase
MMSIEPDEDRDGQAFADRWWQSADGLTLHARDYSGPADTARLPVVCLHGLTRNARDFEDFAPEIARAGRRVVVAEMRGRGESAYDPDPANYHFATYAADVALLLDALGIDRAIFVGTSMGGVITLYLSDLRPELIAGVVLNDIGPEVAAEGIARISNYVGKPAPVTDWQSAADYARATNGTALPSYGADDWLNYARRMFRDGPAGVPVLDYDTGILGAAVTPLKAPAELWAMLESLVGRCPTLALRGALSDILSPDILDRMKVRAPALRVAVVPGVGHAPVLDEPEALEAIVALLDDVDTGRSRI